MTLIHAVRQIILDCLCCIYLCRFFRGVSENCHSVALPRCVRSPATNTLGHLYWHCLRFRPLHHLHTLFHLFPGPTRRRVVDGYDRKWAIEQGSSMGCNNCRKCYPSRLLRLYPSDPHHLETQVVQIKTMATRLCLRHGIVVRLPVSTVLLTALKPAC